MVAKCWSSEGLLLELVSTAARCQNNNGDKTKSLLIDQKQQIEVNLYPDMDTVDCLLESIVQERRLLSNYARTKEVSNLTVGDR